MYYKKHTLKAAAATFTAALLVGTALAGDKHVRMTTPSAPPMDSYYRAGEIQLGVSALFAARSGDRTTANNAANPAPLGLGGGALATGVPVGGTFGTDDGNELWGADVDVTYFLTRNFGLGVEQQWINAGRPIWNSTFNLVLRAPLSETSRWAPYLFGGVGAVYASGEGRLEGHAGAGIEYRWTPRFGTFADGRYTWVDGRNDRVPQYGAFRAGLRVAF